MPYRDIRQIDLSHPTVIRHSTGVSSSSPSFDVLARGSMKKLKTHISRATKMLAKNRLENITPTGPIVPPSNFHTFSYYIHPPTRYPAKCTSDICTEKF